MSQQFDTVDVLSLEIETPPGGSVQNLVKNRSGALGAWGWLTADPNVSLGYGTGAGAPYLSMTPSVSMVAYVWTEPIAMTAGNWAGGSLNRISTYLNSGVRVRLEFLNVNGSHIASGAQSALTTANGQVYAPTTQAPAGTAYVRLRVDGYLSGGSMTAGTSINFKEAMVTWASTQAGATGFAYVEPSWTNILGPSHSITVDRASLDVGTLVAVINDSTIDPAVSNLIRRGRAVRLADTSGNSLFTGSIRNAVVDYYHEAGTLKANINLTAVDNVSTLTQHPRANSYGTTSALKITMEGCGTPWNINGSRAQGGTPPTPVAVLPEATALDIIAAHRDTSRGLAWVDREGTLTYYDPGHVTLPTTTQATLGEDDYTSLDTDFDIERCINVVTITNVWRNGAGETVETVWGPYRDQASIDEWGVGKKDFRTHGLTNDESTMQDYASEVFATNATPVYRVNGLSYLVTTTGDLTLTAGSRRAFLDLGDKVDVDVPSKTALSDTLRITGVRHTITPKRWTTDLSFVPLDNVASPQETPGPSTTASDNTDWVSLTHSGTSGTLRYRYLNGIVYVEGNITISMTTGASVTLLTAANGIPAEHRPSQSLWMAGGRINVASALWPIARFTDGSIVAVQSSGSTATSIQFAYSYALG